MARGQKRNAAAREPGNLKRFKTIIQAYTKEHDDKLKAASEDADSVVQDKEQHTTGVRSPKGGRSLSRKEKRKEARQLKKARKHAFKQHKTLPTKESIERERKEQLERNRKREETKKKRRKQRKRKAEKLKQEKEAVEEEQNEIDTRKQGLLEANAAEDKVIKQLEKHLKLKKRKRKNLPQAFVNDGLDFLLDVVDPSKLGTMRDEEDKADVFGVGFEEEDDSDERDSDEDEEEEQDSEREDSEEGEEEEEDYEDEMADEDKEEEEKEDEERDFSGEDSEDDLDGENVKGILSKQQAPSQLRTKDKAVHFSEKSDQKPSQVSEESDDSDIGEEEDDGNGSLEEEEEDEGLKESSPESESDENEEETSKKKKSTQPKYKEDIYGRLRDEQGNVVDEKAVTGAHYIPPAKRLALAKPEGKKKVELDRMKKKLKGLINRLSEANIQPISSQIEDQFRTSSRAELTEVLTDIILAVCVAPTLVPERLIMEHALLIAVLHGNVGSEVGALFLQTIAKQFEETSQLPNYGPGKEIDNLLVLLSHMFNFKIVHSNIIFDICQKLANSFQERDIELLLLVLKNVGFSLRKDDPAALKELIINIQGKASNIDTSSFKDQSRVKFMLEVMLAIRNNNMRKIPNYDPSHCDHLKKLLRNYVRGSNASENQLRISLEDLLSAEDKGRWWLVGSAWTGPDARSSADTSTTSHNSPVVNEIGDKILELARKQRMNTDVRKNIFCILMTSEDFVDAFEKLLRLGLKHQQEREIIHVILDVCFQEKAFNPFYAYLLQKFSEYDRRFLMTLQFALWDKFKELQSLSDNQITNLARLLIHLIATKAMSMSVFKVIEFGELDKVKVKLMKKVLLGLLTDHPEYIVKEAFQRIAPYPKLNMLREGLKLFIQHFVLRNKGKVVKLDEELQEKIKIAEKMLSASDSGSLWL